MRTSWLACSSTVRFIFNRVHVPANLVLASMDMDAATLMQGAYKHRRTAGRRHAGLLRGCVPEDARLCQGAQARRSLPLSIPTRQCAHLRGALVEIEEFRYMVFGILADMDNEDYT